MIEMGRVWSSLKPRWEIPHLEFSRDFQRSHDSGCKFPKLSVLLLLHCPPLAIVSLGVIRWDLIFHVLFIRLSWWKSWRALESSLASASKRCTEHRPWGISCQEPTTQALLFHVVLWEKMAANKYRIVPSFLGAVIDTVNVSGSFFWTNTLGWTFPSASRGIGEHRYFKGENISAYYRTDR